jgi:hypothetical protein
VVSHGKAEPYYCCNTSNRDIHGCPPAAISTRMLDAQVWERVEEVLTNPQVIANEVARLRNVDPTGPNLAALDKRIAEVERQRTNLMRRLATIDDDEMAAPFLVEIQALGGQHKQLRRERDELDAEHQGWQRAQECLDDLQSWCRVQLERLANLTYEQKRLALFALHVEATVWSKDHDLRFSITMQIDLDTPLSDPRLPAGAALGEGHVDGYSRRGCARRGGRHAGRL